ncbi:MAG TPA: enoyl-CoA hydratase-related protein [Novosphingobium sp.]
MSDELILTDLEHGVLTLTLHRPEAMNAMTTAMGNRFAAALDLARRDPDVRVVVVTGAGRGFCAGGDIKNLGQVDPQDPLAVKHGGSPRWNDVEMRVQRLNDAALAYYQLSAMPKPTIAMVNGPAIGAGMAPALACDFRVMSTAAYFNCGYANMGLSGDVGTAYHLVNVVGPARTRELMFMPRKIGAEEALRIGLVTRVAEPDGLLDTTMAVARELAAGPTLAYGHMKENIQAAVELDPRTAFDIEARNFMRCFQTEDHKEAVRAFKEKRKPVFTGQ